jgi:hypothetical protein
MIMLTLNMLDAIGADRLHRRLSDAWCRGQDHVARRRYRMQWRVYIQLHKALLRAQAVA